MNNENKNKKIYFIFIIIGLIALSPIVSMYKRSKVQFFVEEIKDHYIYHISLDCENIKNKSKLVEVKELFLNMNSAEPCNFCNKNYTKLNY